MEAVKETVVGAGLGVALAAALAVDLAAVAESKATAVEGSGSAAVEGTLSDSLGVRVAGRVVRDRPAGA